jgi:hypothetical protein
VPRVTTVIPFLLFCTDREIFRKKSALSKEKDRRRRGERKLAD